MLQKPLYRIGKSRMGQPVGAAGFDGQQSPGHFVLALRAAFKAPDTIGVILQRMERTPQTLRPADILQLQRTIGNRATGLLLQAKLKLGPAGDRYEQEADRVARQVVRASHQPNVQRNGADEEELQAKPLTDSISPIRRALLAPLPTQRLQRYDIEEEKVQAKRTFLAPPQMPKVQRTDMDEEELQASPNHGLEGGDVDTDVARSIQSAKGGGAPLHDLSLIHI